MLITTIPPRKPRSSTIHPEITRLPSLSLRRRFVRLLVNQLARFLTWAFTNTQVEGLGNLPSQGPAIIVINHLGDADLVIGLAVSPVTVETFAKAELYDYPILGKLMDSYGVIWVHRGRPDRKAIRTALKALAERRIVGIAPEGRESLTGSLEEGTGGAAYLALKADAPIVPVTITGTENTRIYSNMKRLRRTVVVLKIGPLFRLEPHPDFRQAIRTGTDIIMHKLASQLPSEYRGVYSMAREGADETLGQQKRSEL